jgi:hypothetical protein
VACFSIPKNDRQLTSVSPAIHHKFTIKKPRSAPRFCQDPQQKRRLRASKKTAKPLSLPAEFLTNPEG